MALRGLLERQAQQVPKVIRVQLVLQGQQGQQVRQVLTALLQPFLLARFLPALQVQAQRLPIAALHLPPSLIFQFLRVPLAPLELLAQQVQREQQVQLEPMEPTVLLQPFLLGRSAQAQLAQVPRLQTVGRHRLQFLTFLFRKVQQAPLVRQVPLVRRELPDQLVLMVQMVLMVLMGKASQRAEQRVKL